MDIKLLEKLLEVQEAVAALALKVAAAVETAEADEVAINAQSVADATALRLHRARAAQGEKNA